MVRIKEFIPPVLLPVLKRSVSMIKAAMGGRRRGVAIPWSAGYISRKLDSIKQSLSNGDLIKNFASGALLPENYGFAIDERIIEYPWLFANLPLSSTIILDAGSILNHELIAGTNLSEKRKIHIMTLAPEGNNYLQDQGVSYLYGDLREIPIKDNYYDAVVCLSTLEHIGCDNSIYSNNKEHEEKALADFLKAIQEFRRVLKVGGSLFVTVPFGKYQFFGNFQQFDLNLLERAIHGFGKAEVLKKDFYKYNSDGWQKADAQDCADCQYVKWVAQAHWTIPSTIPVETDMAAAARAVACIHLRKLSYS